MSLSLVNSSLILQRYIRYMGEKGYSNRTISTYSGLTRLFFKYLKDNDISDLKDVDKDILRRYQSHLYSNTDLGLAGQESRLVSIKSFFKYLEKTNQILYDPSYSIELPRIKDTLPRSILSEPEIKKLLNSPGIDTPIGLRDRAILEVFYSTGIRNTELRNLTLYDIDFDTGRIFIRLGKGGKDRVVPIGDIALNYVREYIDRLRPCLVKANDINILFVSLRGKKLTDDIIPWIVQKYARIAGISKTIGAHTIRHSFATHILRHGAPIRYIQEMLGHRSLDTTQRYTRVEITDLKKVHKKTHPREIGA